MATILIVKSYLQTDQRECRNETNFKMIEANFVQKLPGLPPKKSE